MLHQLSLRKLEELHAKLAEVEKILNPEQLNYEGLYKTSNHDAIKIRLMQDEVFANICKIFKERDNK